MHRKQVWGMWGIVSQSSVLVTREARAGFFSDFFWAMDGIRAAKDSGLEPVVHFGLADCKGQTDCQQLSGWSWVDFFVIDGKTPDGIDCGALRRIGGKEHPSEGRQTPIETIRATFRTHCGFNESTKAILDTHRAFPEGERVLGVHFRAGDMRWAPSHPTPPSKKLMLKLIAKELSKNLGYSSVFVASEDRRFISSAKRAFPNVQVVTSPRLEEGDRGLKFVKQLSVLIDANNLAFCEAVIHSPSNVAAASQVIADSYPNRRLEVHIGTNHPRLPISIVQGVLFFELLASAREKSVQILEYQID